MMCWNLVKKCEKSAVQSVLKEQEPTAQRHRLTWGYTRKADVFAPTHFCLSFSLSFSLSLTHTYINTHTCTLTTGSNIEHAHKKSKSTTELCCRERPEVCVLKHNLSLFLYVRVHVCMCTAGQTHTHSYVWFVLRTTDKESQECTSVLFVSVCCSQRSILCVCVCVWCAHVGHDPHAVPYWKYKSSGCISFGVTVPALTKSLFIKFSFRVYWLA